MTTTALPIHSAPTPHPRPALRTFKTTVLVLAFLAGIGAITVAATANAMTEESASMAGYA
jgi:hypothetical protein